MTTAIVILNWNGRYYLEKYLPCLLKSVEGNPDIRVIVADNASDDDSCKLVSEKFPETSLVRFGKNFGFAGGYNKVLRSVDADCFLLLNSDVRVEPGWIEPLVEWMELHPECGVCGPKLHQEPDNGRFEYSGAAGGFLDRLCFPFCRGRVMNRLEEDKGQYDIPADVLWVSGAALMIRKDIFLHIGGFCNDFFAHMEEIDLCWRVRLAGWKVTVVPRSTVFHIGGGSLPPDSPMKLKLNFRNNLLMMQRNLPMTFALNVAFNLLAKETDLDEGPDIFGLCTDSFNQYDRTTKRELTWLCTRYGIDRTAILIRHRMVVDGLAAMAYLLKGKPAYFKAVIQAHKEFRKLRHLPNEQQIKLVLTQILEGQNLEIARINLTDRPETQNNLASTFAIRGMWSKWTVYQSFLKKDSIFAEIKDNLV